MHFAYCILQKKHKDLITFLHKQYLGANLTGLGITGLGYSSTRRTNPFCWI